MPPGPLSKRALRSNAITLQESVPVDLCHVRSTGLWHTFRNGETSVFDPVSYSPFAEQTGPSIFKSWRLVLGEAPL